MPRGDPDDPADTPNDIRRKDIDAAFKRLYEEHSKAIMEFFRHSKRMSVTDAGDLLQLTFMELLKALHRKPELVDELRKPRVFLYTLAHRQFVAWLRHKNRRIEITDEPEDEIVESQAAADDEELLHSLRSEQRLMLRALRRLDDPEPEVGEQPAAATEVSRHQMVLYLRFWADLTLAEVARVLDLPVGTVSSKQRRGLALLEKRLDDLESRDAPDHRTSTETLLRWQERVRQEALGEGPRSDEGGG